MGGLAVAILPFVFHLAFSPLTRTVLAKRQTSSPPKKIAFPAGNIVIKKSSPKAPLFSGPAGQAPCRTFGARRGRCSPPGQRRWQGLHTTRHHKATKMTPSARSLCHRNCCLAVMPLRYVVVFCAERAPCSPSEADVTALPARPFAPTAGTGTRWAVDLW